MKANLCPINRKWKNLWANNGCHRFKAENIKTGNYMFKTINNNYKNGKKKSQKAKKAK